MNRASMLHKVLAWLRAGYPEGIPQHDYVAVLAVLGHTLTDTEIRHVAAELSGEHAPGTTVDDSEIEAAIRALAMEKPSEADVARVRARLAAGGWPLADPTPT